MTRDGKDWNKIQILVCWTFDKRLDIFPLVFCERFVDKGNLTECFGGTNGLIQPPPPPPKKKKKNYYITAPSNWNVYTDYAGLR